MKSSSSKTLFLILTLVLAALVAAGCGDTQAGNTAAADGQKLPFQGDAAKDAAAADQPSKLLAGKPLVIPAGTTIAVRLQQSLSSSTAVSGQAFDAVLAEPLVVNGEIAAPRYAPVSGRVIGARKSGRLHNAGYLRLGLTSITLEEREVLLETSSIFAHGGSYKKRNTAYIGGGAAGGALIGALAGGGKGALIGSAVGAGAGTTAAYSTGKKDVGYTVERRLSFRLTQPVTLAR